MRLSASKALALAGTLAVLAAAYAVYHVHRRAPEVHYRFATVERGTVEASIAASGTLNAVSTASVRAGVSGQVKDLYVDFNTAVKKGQVLARVDPAAFELRVAQARADLSAAEATLAQRRETLAALRAERDAVRAAVTAARRKPERDGARPGRSAARARLDSLLARLRTLDKQTGLAGRDEAAASSALRRRRALLGRAEFNLDHTDIRSPIDGTVVLRNVDVGQKVTPGDQAPVLFVIAHDLHDMQVDAPLAIDQAKRLRVGLTVHLTVDALPRKNFAGEVRALTESTPPGGSGERVTTARIAVNNPDLLLLPGMIANLRIVLARHDDVLKLADAALDFTPPAARDGTRRAAPARAGVGRVWVPTPDGPRPVEIKLGLDDGTHTEIVGGPLREGDRVIVALAAPPPAGSRPDR